MPCLSRVVSVASCDQRACPPRMVCAGEAEHATGAWAGVMEPARAPAAHASLHTAHAWADGVCGFVSLCVCSRVVKCASAAPRRARSPSAAEEGVDCDALVHLPARGERSVSRLGGQVRAARLSVGHQRLILPRLVQLVAQVVAHRRDVRLVQRAGVAPSVSADQQCPEAGASSPPWPAAPCCSSLPPPWQLCVRPSF